MVLFGPQEAIRQAVTKCLVEAGPRQHILNVGHGVIEGTPEENVVRSSGQQHWQALHQSVHAGHLALWDL